MFQRPEKAVCTTGVHGNHASEAWKGGQEPGIRTTRGTLGTLSKFVFWYMYTYQGEGKERITEAPWVRWTDAPDDVRLFLSSLLSRRPPRPKSDLS